MPIGRAVVGVRPAAPWWRRGVVYQVYPRSFQDSDGDGVGDLKGIEQSLPYLQRLGVTSILLTPLQPSLNDCLGAMLEQAAPLMLEVMEGLQVGAAASGPRRVRALQPAAVKAVIDYVETRRDLDATRIGMWGWSYGGYMTSTIITSLIPRLKVSQRTWPLPGHPR